VTIFYVIFAWNLITFAVTGLDKLAARRRRRRVPEKYFLCASAFLGGAGVLIGFYITRHKTKHYSLLAKTWLITLLSFGAALCIYFYYA